MCPSPQWGAGIEQGEQVLQNGEKQWDGLALEFSYPTAHEPDVCPQTR